MLHYSIVNVCNIYIRRGVIREFVPVVACVVAVPKQGKGVKGMRMDMSYRQLWFCSLVHSFSSGRVWDRRVYSLL